MYTEFHVSNRFDTVRALKGGLIVLPAYTQLQRQNDGAFAFNQEANFRYLTGITKPDWLCIVDGSSGEEWLVSPEISKVHETFDGSLKPASASAISGIKKVISRDEATLLLRKLAKKHSVVYTVDIPLYAEHFNFALNPAILANKKMLERTFTKVVDCQKELAKLRAIKQPEEIKAIQKAIDITIEGFNNAKNALPALKYEYQMESIYSHHFRYNYGAHHAYEPIVASGKNACTLHYGENNAKIAFRELVLIDIGASHDGYAADITRTYAKGEPSKRRQAVHAAVKAAHEQIIKLISPNASLEGYSNDVDEIMKDALQSLGLLKNRHDNQAYRTYFPHAISHGLGLDVHDSLGGFGYFKPGMVLTVEPGIYIPEEGIGVRIEDNILVTEKGHKNMSAKLSTDW